MQKKQRKKVKVSSGISGNVVGILVSALSAIIITFLLTAFIAFLQLRSEKIADSYIMYFYFCGVFSSFIGGFISSKKCTFKGVISGLITSLTYNFILTVILLFVSLGKLRADTGILYAVTTAFFALGGIAGANTKRRK